MAWLFHLQNDALTQLWQSAKARTVFVRAFGAPFEVKDALKDRGYRWHNGSEGANKHWWCEIAESDLEAEQQFLNHIYHRGAELAHYDYRDATSRFKAV
jgi:DNA polymerase-3 subunit epsilon